MREEWRFLSPLASGQEREEPRRIRVGATSGSADAPSFMLPPPNDYSKHARYRVSRKIMA